MLRTEFIAAWWLAVRAFRLDDGLRSTGISLLVFLLIQAGLGMAAVLTGLPLLLVTAHNAVAELLFLAVVNLIHLSSPIGHPSSPRAGL